MSPTVVLFPGVVMGHLTPMVELAKLFIRRGFSATVVTVDFPIDPLSAVATFISRTSAAHPSISFHRLPKIPIPSRTHPPHPVISMFDLLRLSSPHLKHFLQALTQAADVRALIVCLFCTDALDVAAQLGIPSYIFFTTSASNLAAFLSLPAIESQTSASFKDLGGELINVPGVPPMPAYHMLDHLQDRNLEEYRQFAYHLRRLPMADGIVINTFESLEQGAVRALRGGQVCVPSGRVPPIYCIGPVVSHGGSQEEEEKHECLKWLDVQPKGGVVFLCFGSLGFLPAEQLTEIAVGLERSGQRFLWVVRSLRSDARAEPLPDPDLSMLMPEGFLERTEGRGMVVKSWAPQVAVLRHESVGGFVSHCGWNSILEAVTAGVPIIAWPLYAEQRMNKVFLVEEPKLAVEMKGYDKDLVRAEEIANKLRWLMESEGGRELRDRAGTAKENAIKAWNDGGSSASAWMELVSILSLEANQNHGQMIQ